MKTYPVIFSFTVHNSAPYVVATPAGCAGEIWNPVFTVPQMYYFMLAMECEIYILVIKIGLITIYR